MGEDKAFYENVAMTYQEITEFLAPPRIARISTVEGNKPHTTPVWYLYDGRNFFISTGATRKARDLKKNANVSLVIDQSDGMFRHKCVIVEGRAQLIEGQRAITRKIHARYLGEEGLKHPFAQDLLSEEQCVVKIEPTRMVTWDYTKAVQS